MNKIRTEIFHTRRDPTWAGVSGIIEVCLHRKYWKIVLFYRYYSLIQVFKLFVHLTDQYLKGFEINPNTQCLIWRQQVINQPLHVSSSLCFRPGLVSSPGSQWSLEPLGIHYVSCVQAYTAFWKCFAIFCKCVIIFIKARVNKRSNLV